MKKIIIAVIAIAAVGGTIYTLNKNKKQSEEETTIVAQKNSHISVRASKAEYRAVNTQYIANGIFKPKQEVNLSAETAGRVIRVLVSEGSHVKAGQTLAIIKGDKLNVNVNNAMAVYHNAMADVNRFENAYASGGVTKQQLDQIKLKAETARNSLKAAKLAASDVNITASFSGVINTKNIEAGAFVAPGQPLFNIVNVSTLKLSVAVDEKSIGTIRTGQNIEVSSDVYPDINFEGKITFIAPKADASLKFPVEIEIKNNSNNDLRAGMYGTAYFGNKDSSKVLTIDRNAFVGSVNSNKVYVIKNGKAVLKTIVSGRNFGDYIEVVSGLNNGEQIVTSGQINLYDQAPVQIIK